MELVKEQPLMYTMNVGRQADMMLKCGYSGTCGHLDIDQLKEFVKERFGDWVV